MSYQVADQWEWTLKVDSYMVGPEWTLRPAYQLKLQQEVGERHFAAGGLGYETLYREGVVFVLTRLNSVIRRAPRLHETVRLQTWHRSPKGSQFFRCYRFLSEAGDPLIESVSAFTLVDPVQHRRQRLKNSAWRGKTIQWTAPIRRKCGCPQGCNRSAIMSCAGRRSILTVISTTPNTPSCWRIMRPAGWRDAPSPDSASLIARNPARGRRWRCPRWTTAAPCGCRATATVRPVSPRVCPIPDNDPR